MQQIATEIDLTWREQADVRQSLIINDEAEIDS
jgi:hypothetical protein